jgi:hypothetical protein
MKERMIYIPILIMKIKYDVNKDDKKEIDDKPETLTQEIMKVTLKVMLKSRGENK